MKRILLCALSAFALLWSAFPVSAEVISTSVTNMTAAAHTVDLDGSVNAVTSTPQAETATLWAVTMELPAVASSTGGLLLRGAGN